MIPIRIVVALSFGFAILFAAKPTARDGLLNDERIEIWSSKRSISLRLITQSHCLLYDATGPLCEGRVNLIFISHWDQEHVPLHPPASLLRNSVVCTRYSLPPPPSFGAWLELPLCRFEPDFSVPTLPKSNPAAPPLPFQIKLLSSATLDWDSNEESEVLYFEDFKLLILGDRSWTSIRKLQEQIRSPQARWIVLPSKGSTEIKKFLKHRWEKNPVLIFSQSPNRIHGPKRAPLRVQSSRNALSLSHWPSIVIMKSKPRL